MKMPFMTKHTHIGHHGALKVIDTIVVPLVLSGTVRKKSNIPESSPDCTYMTLYYRKHIFTTIYFVLPYFYSLLKLLHDLLDYYMFIQKGHYIPTY